MISRPVALLLLVSIFSSVTTLAEEITVAAAADLTFAIRDEGFHRGLFVTGEFKYPRRFHRVSVLLSFLRAGQFPCSCQRFLDELTFAFER